MTERWTAGQYALVRVLLGTYLFVHFVHLLPWAGEVFSSAGMLSDASASPLLRLFPNVLAIWDDPWAVAMFVVAAACCAVLFTIGVHDKAAAFAMWYVLACLYTRNPLIANPGLPYLGWMLLAHLFIPSASFGSASRPERTGAWAMPQSIFAAAWVVLALSYSYSGYTKLLSPSWVSGDTIRFVLDNPLARDYFLRELFLALPDGVLRALTWLVLYVELAFAPLAFFKRLRPILWSTMLVVQLGFLALLNFADLTAPMLFFHLLTFDPAWVRPAAARSGETIYYDGHCGFCHWVVRFVLQEDSRANFRFAPLQGDSFREAVPLEARSRLPDTFVVVDDRGRLHIRSDAVVHVLRRLGGSWGALGVLLRAIPQPLRDLGYRAVGRVRHRLFARPGDVCPVVPSALRYRFSR